MGDGELNKHWPSELVSFTDLSQLHTQYNLFTTRSPCNYQHPSRGQAGAWGELTLTAEREEEEGGGGREGGRAPLRGWGRVVCKWQILEGQALGGACVCLCVCVCACFSPAYSGAIHLVLKEGLQTMVLDCKQSRAEEETDSENEEQVVDVQCYRALGKSAFFY